MLLLVWILWFVRMRTNERRTNERTTNGRTSESERASERREEKRNDTVVTTRPTTQPPHAFSIRPTLNVCKEGQRFEQRRKRESGVGYATRSEGDATQLRTRHRWSPKLQRSHLWAAPNSAGVCMFATHASSEVVRPSVQSGFVLVTSLSSSCSCSLLTPR